MLDFYKIGLRLRETRVSKKISMEKLAQLSGVSFTTIYRIEKGAKPDAETIAKIAVALGVSTDFLLCINELKGQDTESSYEFIMQRLNKLKNIENLLSPQELKLFGEKFKDLANELGKE